MELYFSFHGIPIRAVFDYEPEEKPTNDSPGVPEDVECYGAYAIGKDQAEVDITDLLVELDKLDDVEDMIIEIINEGKRENYGRYTD